MDLNHRPLGYEPNELPDCSTPHPYPIAAQVERQIIPAASSPVRARRATLVASRSSWTSASSRAYSSPPGCKSAATFFSIMVASRSDNRSISRFTMPFPKRSITLRSRNYFSNPAIRSILACAGAACSSVPITRLLQARDRSPPFLLSWRRASANAVALWSRFECARPGCPAPVERRQPAIDGSAIAPLRRT